MNSSQRKSRQVKSGVSQVKTSRVESCLSERRSVGKGIYITIINREEKY